MRNRILLILGILLTFSCTDYTEQRDCGEIRIDVGDTLLISSETVLGKIRDEYGCCIGKNLDSLDLGLIEGIVDSCAAVSKGQAWITRDGVLHIKVATRVPEVRLCKGEVELFCDRSGYLFPTGDYPPDGVCRIMGDIPIPMRAGTHGQPGTEEQRNWLQGVMDVAEHGFDGEISVVGGGELRLLPRNATEVFLFGTPDNIADKFDMIDRYTDRIRPVKEYKTVNVKYKGQIICRNDI